MMRYVLRPGIDRVAFSNQAVIERKDLEYQGET